MAVIQATSASGPGGARTLSTTGPVYSGDRIKTGKAGEAQIRFIDDTRLVVGASSSIVIDKYVFNPDKTVAQVGLQFTKGTLRFITGSGPKRAYSIVTPTATLGVRGTRFDVAVGGQIGTGVVVFDGEVEMCSRRTGRCTIIRSGCGAAVASPDGSLGSPRSAADKAALIRTQFPLVGKQRSLRAEFRVSTGKCGLTAPGVKTPGLRQINFSPLDAPGPIDGPGPSDPPGSSGGDNPGTSGRTPGASHSSSSHASDTATGGPGKSSNSRAGKKKK